MGYFQPTSVVGLGEKKDLRGDLEAEGDTRDDVSLLTGRARHVLLLSSRLKPSFSPAVVARESRSIPAKVLMSRLKPSLSAIVITTVYKYTRRMHVDSPTTENRSNHQTAPQLQLVSCWQTRSRWRHGSRRRSSRASTSTTGCPSRRRARPSGTTRRSTT